VIRALLARLRLTHANHRRIATGAFWVGLVVLAAKLCAAAREMAIAWRYGISAEVDAYQLALTVTTWLPMWLAGVAGFVLVPRLVALRRSGGDERFVDELNGAVLLLGAGLTALTWIAAPFVMDLVTGALTPSTRRLAGSLAVDMAPIAFLIIVGGYFAARLQAREHYAFGVAEAAPAVTIALFVIVGPVDAGTAPLLYGTVLGWLLYALWLGRMTAVADPPLGRIRVRHRSEQWALLYGPIVTMGLGQLLLTSALPVDQAFAATLGEGAVSTLGYVNRIVTLITSFGFVVLARALLPVLSAAVAEGDHELGRRQAVKWAWLIAGLAAAGTAVAWPLTPLAVRIVFERGAFSAADTALVSEVLRYALLQLPPFFAAIVLLQWYAAANRYTAILVINLVALIAKVGVNALLVEPMGVAGITLSTAAMYGLMALLLAAGAGHRSSRSPATEPV
jgi:peptidoglycan biosynthesis protein MviN/MurJ (putative lipid II flippase)